MKSKRTSSFKALMIGFPIFMIGLALTIIHPERFMAMDNLAEILISIGFVLSVLPFIFGFYTKSSRTNHNDLLG